MTQDVRGAVPARPKLIVVAGPTAAGKSEFAMQLAEGGRGEIVSVDSRQVYRRLDIGTAKPTLEMRAAVPHHLLDVIEPDEPYDAALFAAQAREAISSILGRDRTPILCGGSGLYLRAVTEGMVPLPPPDQLIRAALRDEAEERGDGAMHAELASVDPVAAERIAVSDRRRTLRGLEVFRQTGRSLTDLQNEHGFCDQPYALFTLVLSPPTLELDERIRSRAHRMWKEGLVEETQGVLAAGFDGSLPSLQAIGYREVQLFLAGAVSADEAVDAIVLASRQYAKRQRTWFRRLEGAVRLEERILREDLRKSIGEFLAEGL